MPNPLRALSLLSVVSLSLATVGCQAYAAGGATPLSKIRSQKKPSISAITPSSSSEGSKTVTITVTGSNFTGQSQMLFNGSGRSTTTVSGQKLVGTLQASDVSSPGTAQVSVKDTRTGIVSNSVAFVVTQTSSSSGTQTPSALQITNSSLPGGVLGVTYSAALSASGGTAPYTWSIKSGSLPAGLFLNATTGQVTGTPSQGGQYSASIQVKDAASTAVSAAVNVNISSIALDTYGGLVNKPCQSPGNGRFYTGYVGKRHLLCDPDNNAFFVLSVYHVDIADWVDDLGNTYRNRVIAKYGDADLTWGPQTNRRLMSWGFNSLAAYSNKWTLPVSTISDPRWPTGQQPVKMPYIAALTPTRYGFKNLFSYISEAYKDIYNGANSNYKGYRAPFPDVFDPKFETYVTATIAASSNIDSPWTLGVTIDDTDELWGFGAGPDFSTTPAGHNSPNLAWIALITAPTQSTNTTYAQTYTDTKVYTKYALRDFLANRYGTISTLNNAWGSNYTTFDSNGGFGVGSGLLDEDGRHSWVGTDYSGLTNANANLAKDMNDFLVQLATKYFSIMRTQIKAKYPNIMYMGPMAIGTWGAPAHKSVLQAAGKYVEVIQTNWDGQQATLDFMAQYAGDIPLLTWEGNYANQDSALWRYTGSGSLSSQSNRGAAYQNAVTTKFNRAVTSTGIMPYAGVEFWELLDNFGEKLNWGMITLSDNPYDGVSAVISSGKDAWGYPTGGEEKNYGNIIDTLKSTNQNVINQIESQP